MVEEDIFERLKKQISEASLEKTFYVYYNPSTGEIIHFRNYAENDVHPFIQIKESDIDTPLEKFEMKDYLVLERDKKLKLVKVLNYFNTISDVDDVIYLVPRINVKNDDDDPELIIEQDNLKKVFRISLSHRLREKFRAFKEFRQNMNVYVTEEGDPNILYKTLEFNIHDLVNSEYKEIPFDEFEGTVCNIYLMKYFQSYLHVDLR